MKKLLIGLLICIFLVNFARADHETDSIAAVHYCNRVIDVFEQSPESLLDSPYTKSDYASNDLGYSYSFVTKEKIIHRLIVRLECVYYQANCISYRLNISIPWGEDSLYHLAFGSRLKRSYWKIYGYWQPEKSYQTLDDHDGANDLKLDEEVRQEFNYFLSPYSGLTYGYMVGIGAVPPENRIQFEDLYKHVDSLSLELMFVSINPVTRITAVEYYIRNKKKYKRDKAYYEKRIADILAQTPSQTVGRGCLVGKEKITEKTISQMMRGWKYTD